MMDDLACAGAYFHSLYPFILVDIGVHSHMHVGHGTFRFDGDRPVELEDFIRLANLPLIIELAR